MKALTCRTLAASLCLIMLGCGTTRMAVQSERDVYERLPLGGKPVNSRLLERLMERIPDSLSMLYRQPDSFRLQIIYTQIDRDPSNQPVFRHHCWNVSEQYHYPASTVKLPAAVLSLEKINDLNIPGLTRETAMLTDSILPGDKPVWSDPTSRYGKPTIGQYIRKVLLVSDNDAHNRMYEFLGQQQFNERLHRLGFTRAEMTHRLSIPLNEEQNRLTPAIRFMDGTGKKLFEQPVKVSKWTYANRMDSLGTGYLSRGQLVAEPLDFSQKNRWPLTHIHLLTQYLMFPESQPASQRLRLSEDDYRFLYRYMSMLPGESRYPAYDTAKYYPAYVKFLMYGSEKGAGPAGPVRIFNKVGNAYGFLLDGAYVADFEKGVEFLLSAVIYCNSDGILNDDRYDYDNVGFPFMKWLGQEIYRLELDRPRTRRPDLSRYKIAYAQD